jgi:class 3 adenylate cyclase/tetratricopeptide (TPR) repeat protein
MPTGTILVSDLVASTELRARLGDEQAERLRRTHDRLLRTAIETHGGVVIKGLGDGVLASFPGAAEGLAAAVAIQQAADAHTQHHPDLPLVLRVGLSAGDVTLDGGDVFGTPVVEASRLCAAAQGGQILAADVVRLLVKGRAGPQFAALGELALKGLTEPVATLSVPWERPAAVALPFPDLLRTGDALDFTGRASELELLNAAWKEAQAGERRSVLVGGEPGMGKTRLAAELARSVHPGGSVLYGRCQEGLGVPYEPFVEALAFFCEHTTAHELRSRVGRYPGELVRLLPDLPDLLPGLDPPLRSDPETEQYRLFEAVASWLAAAGEAGGVLLVVDDLHWAPVPTLSLLVHVLRAASPARLLVVGTFRDTEIGPALSAALADLRRTPTERISLTGLSLDELSALLERLSHQASAGTLHEETKGNPFFVGEVLRHLESGVDAVPESVREVIVARVARLAPATATLLGVAAVFGRDSKLQPLAAVAGIDAKEAVEALDEALTARLMEEVSVGGYCFVHALVRSALYETLSQTRRAQLHLRAADAFEGDVARLAHHLLACAPLGEPNRTARACLAAGERALSALADVEAEEWCSQGLRFVDGDPSLRIDLLTALGEAQRRSGAGASRRTLLDAAHLAADQGEVGPLVRAVLANSRGFTSVIGQVDQERLEIIQRALDLVGPEPSAERAELLSLQASELVFADDHERRLQAADEAKAIAARLDDITVRARVGVRRLYACQVPDRAAAMASEASDLVGLADATADPQLRILSRRPMAPLNVGALAEARRWMREALAIADESGQPGLRSRAHFDYAGVIDALGEHEEAERLTQVAFDLGQQAAWPDTVQFYGGRMVAHWLFEGQPEVVTALAAQAVAQSPRLVAWRGVWALGLALSGREEELAAFLAELPSVLATVPVDFLWLSTQYFFAVAHGFGVENLEAAAATYEALLPYRALHAAYGSGYWGPIEVALAIAGRVMGDPEGAMAHHEAAAATIDACGAARACAFNGYQWARTLLASGDHQQALAKAEETLAYCRAKGYTTLVTKTEELLAPI